MLYFRIFYLFVYRYAKGSWKVRMALGIGTVASCIRNMLLAQFSITIYISLFIFKCARSSRNYNIYKRNVTKLRKQPVCNKMLKSSEVTMSSK
jgi:hypothetical protein